MNYELANQLRESGFPRQWRESGSAEKIDGKWVRCRVYNMPPLSELIKACGKGFDQLENTFDGYRAYGQHLGGIWAKSPEEAVAKLWLALQDNK